MTTYRLALIGFGNVGQGLAEILRDRRQELARGRGVTFDIVAVTDVVKGTVYEPAGLDPAELLTAVEESGRLGGAGPAEDWDAVRTIADADVDVVVELTPTDLETGEPATTHVRRAVERGLDVITTNKGPVALHHGELAELAQAKGAYLGIEGTVMSGTPVLRAGRQLLPAGIRRVDGILNGTANYILTKLEGGTTYADALAEAQARGYAEADPTADVEGHDAVAKVVILSRHLLGADLTVADVDRQGITRLTGEDMTAARTAGERWKLIGSVERDGGRVRASVRPRRLAQDHPLASVAGATNAVTFTTEILGEVTMSGPGAGRRETGYAVLLDLLAIHERRAGDANAGGLA